ncbi:hypothetical protein UT300007_27120 [Clostridium sp. CTA-7]
MKYDSLIEDIFKAIPELREEYNSKAEENLIDEETGVHIVFGVIIVPYLVELLKKENDKYKEVIRRTFIFFEEMAKNDDVLIQEVLEFTIIETLIDEGKEVLNNAYNYMLEETKKSSSAVERFFSIK